MSAQTGSLRVFEGAVAIVTGGASGIGKALAQELARRGADVIVADLHVEVAEEVARQIRESGGKASAYRLDVTDFPATDDLVQQTFAEKGRLDFLFNNAGISLGGEVKDYELEDWERVLDVNLRGVIHGIQSAYPRMIEQGFGHIVNTASIAGLLTTTLLAGYAVSKHAVVGLSKTLRVEASQYGVRVSALCPGFIRTPMLAGGPSGTPIKRLRHLSQNTEVDNLPIMGPDELASRALNAIAKNRAIIVIPSKWKILWWIERLSPACSFWLTRLIHRSEPKAPPARGEPKPKVEDLVHS